MGKYDNLLPQLKTSKEVQTTVEVATLMILQKIANKLAEANRLKKLELSSGHYAKISNGDLSDQA